VSKPVGYGNPPVHSRFKKGQSGNPTGRPKKQPSLIDDLKAELAEVIQVTEGGKVRRLTKQRAVAKSMTAQSIKGDPRATSLIAKLCAPVDSDEPAGTPPPLSPTEQQILEDYIEREVQKRAAKTKGSSS